MTVLGWELLLAQTTAIKMLTNKGQTHSCSVAVDRYLIPQNVFQVVLTILDNVIGHFKYLLLVARFLRVLRYALKCSVVICHSNATWSVTFPLVN